MGEIQWTLPESVTEVVAWAGCVAVWKAGALEVDVHEPEAKLQFLLLGQSEQLLLLE